MNYTSDELFNKIYLKNESYLNENERVKIIEDLIYLQNKLEPYGIIKNHTMDELMVAEAIDLYLLHTWQNEFFSIKFFNELRMSHDFLYYM